MSLEDNGSAQAAGGDTGAADAGNPADSGAASATNGSGGEQQNGWWNGLQDEGNRKTVEAKGWASKGLDDVLSSYRELEGRLGKAIVPPGEDAKPEDWDAFYTKMGRPEKPDGYEFKLPDGLPENLPYDGKQADKFKLWAHEAGIPPKQAQVLHDNFVRDYASQLGAMQEAHAKAIEQSHEALVKAWGDPSSETYKRNQELANRALRQQGGTELIGELKSIGALGPNGEVKTPRLAQMLAKVGQELYAEDTLYAGPGGEPNPFSPKSENLAKQGDILRNDPDRARVLIQQAGINPKEYGL